MELKKKSRNLLKYFFRISSAVLLFMAFLGCSSHCFANVSEDYIGFCINKIIENNSNNDIGLNLTTLKNNIDGISNLTNNMNTGLTSADYSNRSRRLFTY